MSLSKLLLLMPLAAYSIDSSRLQFSHDTREYFSEEVKLPGAVVQRKGARAPVKVDTIFSEDGSWALVFEFPDSVTLHQKVSDNSIYIEFNQEIDSPDLPLAQERLSYVLKKFSNGVNTLYLVAVTPAFYNVSSEGKTVVITITPDWEKPVTPSHFFTVAQARLLGEQRKFKKDNQLLCCLESNDPLDKDVGVLRASLEGLYPRWQRQVQTLRRLNQSDPLDEDIYNLLQDARSPQYFKREPLQIGILLYPWL